MSSPTIAVPASAKPPAWEQYRARLDAYRNAKVNYDFSRQNEHTSATGWRLDDYETDLPAEAPGPPEAAGSFAAAQDVLRRYAFPPPDLITGYFDPTMPLEKRIMVLRAHFLVFNFYFGVRVSEVTDEEARPTPSGPAGSYPERVWGYGYRTLEGHFERGQIDFTIHKNLPTGAVQFRIHAVSQSGQIRNPFYWVGFKLFGRILQRKFARESLRRMRELVSQALAQGSPAAAAAGAPRPG
ncbi:DUF1990 domain-containing protein [Hymenobacter siberiensis]|uniref:DUF1990 domain-containing protein n=1 Tax=Hymenobacter siberiensis TaxID=2848396 RepID=UPI001C1E5121|nr:DUF1990 domain-containing protein [Hymenobacter siberiensis]MBU6123171.1 DUF1990 domain-containing protein [Hymenobacter siberiensis]